MPDSVTTLAAVPILVSVNSLLLVALWFFIRAWMKHVETKLDGAVDTKRFDEKIESVEKAISNLCANNTKVHDSLWERANDHGHMAKCVKNGDVCDVIIGGCVISAVPKN
jgi:hypothetical protein